MSARTIALWMIVLSFAFLGMAFLTSYGTFCYELPEIPSLKK
jgi:hypothetical protein